MKFFSRFVDSNDREVRRIQPFVDEANTLETEFAALSDEEPEEEEGEGVTATRPNLVAKFAARDALGLKLHDHIPIAVDVVCGKKFDANEPAVLKDPGAVTDDDMIFDIGPNSAQELVDIIMKAGTVVWNGPVGVFEFDQFGAGTKAIAMAIAETKAFTLAGGGDTIAAIQKYDIYDKVSYISTAGGAFLEYLEGKVLPAVAILEQRAQG